MLRALRRFKRRETLRIAYGDLIRGLSLRTVTAQISYLADAILEAKRSPDLLREMGLRARAAAEQKYRYADSLELFRSLLAAGGAGGERE